MLTQPSSGSVQSTVNAPLAGLGYTDSVSSRAGPLNATVSVGPKRETVPSASVVSSQ